MRRDGAMTSGCWWRRLRSRAVKCASTPNWLTPTATRTGGRRASSGVPVASCPGRPISLPRSPSRSIRRSGNRECGRRRCRDSTRAEGAARPGSPSGTRRIFRIAYRRVGATFARLTHNVDGIDSVALAEGAAPNPIARNMRTTVIRAGVCPVEDSADAVSPSREAPHGGVS